MVNLLSFHGKLHEFTISLITFTIIFFSVQLDRKKNNNNNKRLLQFTNHFQFKSNRYSSKAALNSFVHAWI